MTTPQSGGEGADTPKSKGIFNLYYAAKEKALEELKKPLIRNKVKRKLLSAYDDAENQKLDAMSQITNLRQKNNFEDYDVNPILEQKRKIALATELQSLVKAEYKELFDEEMKVESND